jgi:hypothetical protein
LGTSDATHISSAKAKEGTLEWLLFYIPAEFLIAKLEAQACH